MAPKQQNAHGAGVTPAPAEAHTPAQDASAPAAAPASAHSVDPAHQPTPATTAAAAGASAAGTLPASSDGVAANQQTTAKPGSIADYLNKTEAALHHVDDGNFMGGKFDAHIKRVQQAIDKVQDTGLF